MNASPDNTNVKLSVTNFGPIAKADVDLRPFTVFVGPSNTGKSYLAMLIYTLHRLFGNVFEDSWRRRVHPEPQIRFTDDEIRRLAEWMDQFLILPSHEDDTKDSGDLLPEILASKVRAIIANSGTVGESVAMELRRSFGVAGIDTLVRHRSRAGLSVSLRHPDFQSDGIKKVLEHHFSVNKKKAEFLSKIPDCAPLTAVGIERISSIFEMRRLLSAAEGTLKERAGRFIISRIADLTILNTVGAFRSTAHYLPADRTGIMHAHLVAVASVIERAPLAALRPDNPLPELSGVLADFLTRLVRLGAPSGAESVAGQKLAKSLEDNMLTGAISIENTITEYPEFYYQPRGWTKSLPLMHASSMVSELAPVALYLRHVVQPGETLIIEEPESHLHPALQVEFVRQLAAVVKSGVRVLLTTHSEWILDELANRVLLSQLPKSRRQGLPGEDSALTANEVGVWLFEPKQRPRGSIVREIPFSADEGGFTSDYEDVAIDTHNDWAEISNRIEEMKAR